MDARLINPFISATKTVFKTMLSIDMQMDKPFIKPDQRTSGDLTGVIGFAGDKKGSMCISLKQKGALYVYSTLVGDEKQVISGEVVDALGEITNIISGQARKELEAVGINLTAAIPTVIVGQGLQLYFIGRLPVLSLPFHFPVNGTMEGMQVDFSFE
jgi:chemotaxis protein CheX